MNLLLNLWCIGVVYQLCLVPLVPKVTMVLYCTVVAHPSNKNNGVAARDAWVGT